MDTHQEVKHDSWPCQSMLSDCSPFALGLQPNIVRWSAPRTRQMMAWQLSSSSPSISHRKAELHHIARGVFPVLLTRGLWYECPIAQIEHPFSSCKRSSYQAAHSGGIRAYDSFLLIFCSWSLGECPRHAIVPSAKPNSPSPAPPHSAWFCAHHARLACRTFSDLGPGASAQVPAYSP